MATASSVLQHPRVPSSAPRRQSHSFDIFDTTLLRRCTDPVGVYELAFRKLPVARRASELLDSFIYYRRLAEALARRNAMESRGRPEVGIDEIYAAFPGRSFGFTSADTDVLVAAEFAAEQDLCYLNPLAARKITAARAAGHRTGFISDTYWSAAQLAALLRGCGIADWDFLYASCEAGLPKSAGLLQIYLASEGLAPADAVHFGDNPAADIRPAAALGIAADHHAYDHPRLAETLERENSLYALLCPQHPDSLRLDGGLRSLRRLAHVEAPTDEAVAGQIGRAVIGPLLATFDRFVAARVERLESEGRQVAVAFVGRDGFLPRQVWQTSRSTPAHYIEINRRVALVGAARSLKPIADMFATSPVVSARVARDFLKRSVPAIEAFFRNQPIGVTSGRQFAQALPSLIDDKTAEELAAPLRRMVTDHLTAAIPGFADCTDLVLVDLGYSGTVQHALRQILDREGLSHRLHGLYLITNDRALEDLAEGDHMEGLISDRVVSARRKNTLLKNISVLEQICCAPEGSVSTYRNGQPQREADSRPDGQVAAAAEIQAGAVGFVRSIGPLLEAGITDPFVGNPAAAHWAAAILGRFLLLPTDGEIALLAGFLQDTNLGSQDLIPLATPAATGDLLAARNMVNAFRSESFCMWPAGSMASVSPVHSQLYAMHATGHLSGNIAADAACGSVTVVVTAGGEHHKTKVPCYRTPFGDVRLRVPLDGRATDASVALVLGELTREGLLRDIVVQRGDSAYHAMSGINVKPVALDTLRLAGADRQGRAFRVHDDKPGVVFIPVPPADFAVAVLTVTIALPPGQRLLASGPVVE